MPIRLNHTIVPAHAARTPVQFLAGVLGLAATTRFGAEFAPELRVQEERQRKQMATRKK